MNTRMYRDGFSRPKEEGKREGIAGRQAHRKKRWSQLLEGDSRKDRERGFTMVEVLVILVVLSILGALTVPSGLAYIDQKREEQCCLCQKTVLAYYHTATVDLGSGLTLTDYLEDLNGTEGNLTAKINGGSTNKVYSKTLKNHDSFTIYKNNLAAARKQKCPSGGEYKVDSTGELCCEKHNGH